MRETQDVLTKVDQKHFKEALKDQLGAAFARIVDQLCQAQQAERPFLTAWNAGPSRTGIPLGWHLYAPMRRGFSWSVFERRGYRFA